MRRLTDAEIGRILANDKRADELAILAMAAILSPDAPRDLDDARAAYQLAAYCLAAKDELIECALNEVAKGI